MDPGFDHLQLFIQRHQVRLITGGDAPANARRLIERALDDAWDPARGGFAYTLGFDGKVAIPARYWWPVTEAIGAVAMLLKLDPQPSDEDWYRRIWDFTFDYLIDRTTGAFIPQLDAENRPATNPFYGRPDIYHSVQACLIPLLPTSGSLVRGLMTEGIHV